MQTPFSSDLRTTRTLRSIKQWKKMTVFLANLTLFPVVTFWKTDIVDLQNARR